MIVKNGQTIFDIALIAYQDASRVYDLLPGNLIDNINSDLTGIDVTYTPSVIIQKEAVKKVVSKKPIVTISESQTLFDLSLQYYGGAENVYDLITNNPQITNISSDARGMELTYELKNTFVPLFFRKNGFDVSTKYPVYTELIVTNGLMQENGFYLLQEDGFNILL